MVMFVAVAAQVSDSSRRYRTRETLPQQLKTSISKATRSHSARAYSTLPSSPP